ncbi:MAG: 4Fe-4S binding protein [Candidatus Thermoplasmatota archaeon]|jgi:2-oxoglutarate ferredoxin oxidoreductase subunit delta|nr:4Fe-4S binding protein [Candidatus Thermoplasmatota archaeon]
MEIKTILKPDKEFFSRDPVNLWKFRIPSGRVHVIPERCKECEYCWNYCPQKILEKSDSTNRHGYHPPRVKEGMTEKCVACGMCESICPEFAIFVEEVRQK